MRAYSTSVSVFSRSLIFLLLLISRSVHPHPGPRHTPTSTPKAFTLHSPNFVISSKRITSSSPLSRRLSYSIVRRDRGRDCGGGLLFLVHHSVNFTNVDFGQLYTNNPFIELLAINILINQTPLVLAGLILFTKSFLRPQPSRQLP